MRNSRTRNAMYIPAPRCRAACLAALVVAAACGDSVAPGGAEIAAITIEPAPASLEEGDQLQLRAALRDANGAPLEGRQVFWATEDTTVARVSSSGMLTGLKTGATRVAASAEGKHGVADVEVRRRAVARVRVSPDTASLRVSHTVQLEAMIFDSRDTRLTDRTVAWQSRASDIAQVDGAGVVRGIRPGVTYVLATAEGKADSARVRVTSGPPARVEGIAGDGQQGRVGAELSQPLVVQVTDSDGNPVGGVPVAWSVTRGEGSIAPTPGGTDSGGRSSARWTLGERPGEQRVTASVSGAGSAVFLAHARPATANQVVIDPDSLLFSALHDRAPLQARVYDEFGNPLDAAAVTWTSLAPAVATVDASGSVEARANGTTHVVAAVAAAADTAIVRVQQLPATLGVAPRSATLNALGRTVRLAATVRDRNGFGIDGAAVQWQSLAPTIASVDAGGMVTARAAGIASVRATVAGLADSAAVVVQQVVAFVSVSPATASVAVGGTQQFAAAVADSSGAAVSGASVTWNSSNPAVADISSGGLATGRAPGTATLRATAGTVSGAAVLSVAASRVASDRICRAGTNSCPDRINLDEDDSARLEARAFAADGGRVEGRPVRWSSSNPSIASVDEQGLVRARRAGEVVIVAVVDDVSGSIEIRVRDG